MLKVTILSHIFVVYKLLVAKVLTANEISGIKGDDELIQKSGKLLKTKKLSKSLNLKGKKLFKS